MELKEVIQKKLHDYKICLDFLVAESELPELKELWQLYASAGDIPQDINTLLFKFSLLEYKGGECWEKNKNILSAVMSFKTATWNFDSDNPGVCLDSLLAIAYAFGKINGVKDEKATRAKLQRAGKIPKKREIIQMYREPRYRGFSAEKAAREIEPLLIKKYGEKDSLKFDTIRRLILKHEKILKRINESSGLNSRRIVHKLLSVFVNATVSTWDEKDMLTTQEEAADAVRIAVNERVEIEVLRMVDEELFAVK